MIFALALFSALAAGAAEPAVQQDPAQSTGAASVEVSTAPAAAAEEPEAGAAVSTGPACRAVHLTAWIAGTSKTRREFLRHLEGTVINAVVLPIKETDGRVYIPGVAKAAEFGSQLTAIPRPEEALRDFREAGLRSIARIAVFKDNFLARRSPKWAVHRPDGALWRNKNGIAWTDPYQRPIWEYNIEVALRAAQLGFDEIQFDYVRFPSDGNTKLCRYSNARHSRAAAIADLRQFVKYARFRLAPTGKPVSIAVFGMTTTASNDMGIGQELVDLAGLADYVSPMMYPSHYRKGEYGLADPNREPYKVIHLGLRDAKARLGGQAGKLRPYLQDFSLYGVHYGAAQVRAQILAAHREGVESWILWNPRNNYTWDVLTPRALSAAGVPVAR